MMDPTDQSSRDEFEVSRRLAEDLRLIHRRRPEVPPEVDRAVLAMYRRRFARPVGRVVALRWAAAGAVAAALLLGIALMLPARWRTSARATSPLAVRQDVDRNGRVDILDAFALARRVETGRGLSDEWDFNGDGAVDRADADVVAGAAVSLERGAL